MENDKGEGQEDEGGMEVGTDWEKEEEGKEVTINGIPFVTSFPPLGTSSKSSLERREAEMERRRGYEPGDLVPSDSEACDEHVRVSPSGLALCGRSRAYIPFESDSNCDFAGTLDRVAGALVIDGTGHDKAKDAPHHQRNGAVVCQVLDEFFATKATSKCASLSELGAAVLKELQRLDDESDKRLNHLSCTLSLAVKVGQRNRQFAMCYNWGDSAILIVNASRKTARMLCAPLNSDFAVGCTHAVGKEATLPYRHVIESIGEDELIVGVTDGILDMFNSDNGEGINALAEALLMVKPEREEAEGKKESSSFSNSSTSSNVVTDGDERSRALVTGVRQVFHEARLRAKARLAAKTMREAELDDMAMFVIPAWTPGLAINTKCTLS